MTRKMVPPELGADSFSCPCCGALAHQTWYATWLKGYSKDTSPRLPTQELMEDLRKDTTIPAETRTRLIESWEKELTGEVFAEHYKDSVSVYATCTNLYVSRCYSCEKCAVWAGDRLVIPNTASVVVPHDEMPDDVKTDFVEAGNIVDQSPRGAAALLRLAIQKLMPHLGEKGKNLNEDIGTLVQQGLDRRIQRALDVVRVVGNNAVHPGQIALEDDKATALRLFDIINVIVASTIAATMSIDMMYEKLPEGALDSIEKRDVPRLETKKVLPE